MLASCGNSAVAPPLVEPDAAVESAPPPSTPPSALGSDLDPVEAFNAASVDPADVPDPGADADINERNLLADVNIAIADVALEAIVFDTFDGGSVSLADATDEQVRGLLNVIPPIDNPVYMPGSEAAWLTDDDLVLGYIADDGTAWAHPHRVLNFHEIVNTTFGGRSVAVTYCPLCGSGVVFDRQPNDLRHDGILTFDNSSALYENDMVMVDEETHTYWWQVSGTGIVGNLTGTRLTLLPSMTTSWTTWLELHPTTQVLSNDQGGGPRYAYDPFAGYATRIDVGRTTFPTSLEAFADERLRPGTRVIGFELMGQPGAVAVLANEPTVVPVGDAGRAVVFLDGSGGGALFSTSIEDVAALFVVRDGTFIDSVTDSSWDAAGRSISGPAEGERLEALPSRSAYWFAWVSTLDGQTTRLYTPTGEQ